jgi:hypothetical protein
MATIEMLTLRGRDVDAATHQKENGRQELATPRRRNGAGPMVARSGLVEFRSPDERSDVRAGVITNRIMWMLR